MSDPARPPEARARAGEASTGPSPVFVLLLLVVLLGVASAIAWTGLRIQRAEAGLLLEELFGPAVELPWGLEPSSAATTGAQQRILRFTRPAGAPQPPDEPNEVVIVRHAGPVPVARQFEPSPLGAEEIARRVEEWKREPSSKFEVQLGAGELEFGRWRVDHVHLREHQEDGHFRDLVRVNITIGDLAQVLSAWWPTDSDAAEPEQLVPLLERIRFDELWESYQARKAKPDGVERGADAATNRPQ